MIKSIKVSMTGVNRWTGWGRPSSRAELAEHNAHEQDKQERLSELNNNKTNKMWRLVENVKYKNNKAMFIYNTLHVKLTWVFVLNINMKKR